MGETIGFVGLGQMGAPMAANLLERGVALVVHNRTRARGRPLVERGAREAARPCDAVPAWGGVVFTMLADDRALEEVALGRGGLLDTLGEGGLNVSLSTVSPALVTRLAADHERKGAALVTAPVFGRPDAAAPRKLWVLSSGRRRRGCGRSSMPSARARSSSATIPPRRRWPSSAATS